MEGYTFKAKAKAKVLIGVFRGGSFGSCSARVVTLLAVGGGSQTGMLIHLRPKLRWYGNNSIDFHCKYIDGFLYFVEIGLEDLFPSQSRCLAAESSLKMMKND